MDRMRGGFQDGLFFYVFEWETERERREVEEKEGLCLAPPETDKNAIRGNMKYAISSLVLLIMSTGSPSEHSLGIMFPTNANTQAHKML